tara:strand:+ start:1320 stop:1670 length:351 start_codon:yes stop_codon:yes gene_type:complete
MYYLFLKTLISAIIIVAVSEIAKRYTWTAAIIVSLPLTSLLAFVWLYWDTKDTQKVIELSYSTIVMSLPSFVFFIILPLLLKFKQSFILSLIISIISTAIAYAIFMFFIKKFNLNF